MSVLVHQPIVSCYPPHPISLQVGPDKRASLLFIHFRYFLALQPFGPFLS